MAWPVDSRIYSPAFLCSGAEAVTPFHSLVEPQHLRTKIKMRVFLEVSGRLTAWRTGKRQRIEGTYSAMRSAQTQLPGQANSILWTLSPTRSDEGECLRELREAIGLVLFFSSLPLTGQVIYWTSQGRVREKKREAFIR